MKEENRFCTELLKWQLPENHKKLEDRKFLKWEATFCSRGTLRRTEIQVQEQGRQHRSVSESRL